MLRGRIVLYTFSFLLLSVITITIRLISILPLNRPPPPKRRRGSPARLLVVLGSGGHTTEMFYMLDHIAIGDFTHRSYVVSSGDAFSAIRAKDFEASKARRKEASTIKTESRTLDYINGKQKPTSFENMRTKKLPIATPDMREDTAGFEISVIPRARRIHQPLYTTPLSALQCLRACLQLLRPQGNRQRRYPDLILLNGPGTAAVMVLAVLILRAVNYRGANEPSCMRIVYIESWARIRSLSLTGRLLLPFVDRFLVQWKGLQRLGRRCEYYGPLVLGENSLERQQGRALCL